MVEALSRKISISSDEPQALNTHSDLVDPLADRAGKAGLHVACSSIEAVFGEAGTNLGKSDGSISADASSQIPNCPSCGSAKIWRNGFRYHKGDVIQRWVCRSCGFRFSGQPLPKNSSVSLNTVVALPYNRQICVEETKNLDSTTEIKTVAGDKEITQQSRGRFIKFLSALENDGRHENSAKLYVRYLERLESAGANLLDSESVKATIFKKKWSPATRALAVASYSKYLSIVGGTWKAPRYQVERKIPYVPTEKEIDCLINAAYSKQSAYLLILKETGMRSSEAWFLQWKDIDFERNAITLNETLKHGTPRMFKVSAKLTATINSLPKISKNYIFQSEPPNPFGLMHFSSSFRALRRRVAAKMQNPNLNRITFHTFRHWFATNEYHKTKSLLHVQERLGHKNILTTTVYTHLINFDSDRYYSATAATVDEAVKLVEAGFEYVCDIEGFKLFRKPK